MKMNESKEELIRIIEDNRASLLERIKILEQIADEVDKLIPKQYDYKSRFVLLDRTKSISELYKTLLDYKTKLNDIVTNEIKIKTENTDDEVSTILNELSVQSINVKEVK
ncbi:MAG: hypothetical protein ACPLX8_01590 [Nanopusillaceae archaeon]